MTFNERIHAVSKFGFNTRQARFLVTVMLHGGVCVPRQYARLAGTAYGHKVNVFFDRLVEARYAERCRCLHNRAAAYHVRHARLYRAIGEPHSRSRKPVPAGRLVERLMLLDFLISRPEITWLATASDKAGFFTKVGAADSATWPHRSVGGTCRYFPDHLPIGVTQEGLVVLVFLATTPLTDQLRAFVRRHTALLEALPAWTVRIVMAPPVSVVSSSLETVVREQLATDHSVVIRNALDAGTGRIESEVLPLSYRHLSPVTQLVRPMRSGVEEGERGGEHAPARPQPRREECDTDDPAGCSRDWHRLMKARYPELHE